MAFDEFAKDPGPREQYDDYEAAMAIAAFRALQWAYSFCGVDTELYDSDGSVSKLSEGTDARVLCERVMKKTRDEKIIPMMKEVVSSFEAGKILEKGFSKSQWVDIEATFTANLQNELHENIVSILCEKGSTAGEAETKAKVAMTQFSYIIHTVINPFNIKD